ncbi:MAG: hypothetical protein E3J29_01485 [Dehalococcoidia bacterium]|nr:MAG: hypothetical protein E3J29_01485 [Dehalococcoidia bacterium]
MLSQHEDLYIPHDERTLRRVQRKLDELDKQVRAWADDLVAVLPKGLALLSDEYDLLALYLAQQRRRNLELDAENGEGTFRSRLGQFLPFLAEDEDEWEISNAAHRMVSTRLESDIDRATDFFCRDHNLPGLVEPVIDWRVAIRYLAQRLHHIACQIDLKRELATSPLRFEMALTARDLAADVVDKRHRMLALFEAAEAR